ncbi:hypothetical protein NDU88_002168 [Pleurodeles waltl]|uniref:Uncharacterized protein n=1 Tax=Pleurodeles waltl TaxID=8319 RepID=A0AAV7W1M1_PLEWA|nr:hypothetical protein NDU88_002168 [Pleurodeles waltl]
MGGSRPPGLHPRGSAQGGAAHLVSVSSAAWPQGSVVGARSRPPRDSLRSLSLPRMPSAQLSASPQPSRARHGRHLVFPSRDRPDLRAGVGCRIPVLLPCATPCETQGHRGIQNGVFLLLWTTLTMGG